MKYLRAETRMLRRKSMVPAVIIAAAVIMLFFLCTSFYKAGYMEAYEVGVVVGYGATADVKAQTAFNIYYDQMHGKHFAGIKCGWLF